MFCFNIEFVLAERVFVKDIKSTCTGFNDICKMYKYQYYCTCVSPCLHMFPIVHVLWSVQVVNTHSSAFHSFKWIMYIAIFFYLQFSFALNFMCIYGIRNPFRGCWGIVCYRKWRDYHLWFWRNFFLPNRYKYMY